MGQLAEDDLIKRIETKRHQDSVRALGLLPLPSDSPAKVALLKRYEFIQEFMRGSRKFGSQRQASEKLAARIAMENLARTAGYPDPIRLEWAMEAESMVDLAEGYIEKMVDDVTLRLSIDPQGNPDLQIEKKGKRLKSMPARLRKAPAVVALRARDAQLKRQVSRIRASLEGAMCRDTILRDLLTVTMPPNAPRFSSRKVT